MTVPRGRSAATSPLRDAARRRPSGLATGVMVVLGLIAIVLVTASRNAGLYPVVMDDEYRYSVAARLQPFAEAHVPNYLFLVIYRATNVCGDAFLLCARWLNLVFFAAAAPSIYLVARQVMSRPLAIAVAALALVGPVSTYTAYFMPESLYYLGFWSIAWLVLSSRPDASLLRFALAGGAIGALALVKPHAIFLLPPAVAFVAIETRRTRGFRQATVFAQASVVVATALLIKFAVGYTIAGRSALTLFGAFYSGIAETAQAPGTGARLAGLLSDLAWNLSGHLMALVLLFALPVAILVASPFASRATGPEAGPVVDRRRLRLFTFLVLGTLIAVASLFTVIVDGQGPYETLARLHARYYDFAFPLLFIVGASWIEARPGQRPVRAVVAMVVAAALVFAAQTGLARFGNGVVDYPELQGITAHTAVKNAAALLGLVSLALWVVKPRYAALWFVLAVLPFAMVKGSISASAQMQGRRTADVYDIAGTVVRRALTRDDAARVVVFGADAAGVYHTLFQLGAAAATARLLDAGAPIGEREWPASHPWAVVVGDHRLDGVEADRVDHEGFVLLHRHPAVR